MSKTSSMDFISLYYSLAINNKDRISKRNNIIDIAFLSSCIILSLLSIFFLDSLIYWIAPIGMAVVILGYYELSKVKIIDNLGEIAKESTYIGNSDELVNEILNVSVETFMKDFYLEHERYLDVSKHIKLVNPSNCIGINLNEYIRHNLVYKYTGVSYR